MPNTAKKTGSTDIKTFTKAVKSKQTLEVLDLLDIHDETSHQRAVNLVGDLMEITGDEEHPLDRLIDRLADAIAYYEEKHFPTLKKSSPVEMIKFFMEAHDLKQADLTPIFGSQGNLSQILKGNRELNLSHIRKLAEQFNVDASLFI
jgi:HTH-type transcriptional regulator / antitoxin HigA